MNTTANRNHSATAKGQPRPEAEAEEALRRQKVAADQVLETGRRIAEDAASITRSGTETFQQTVQSGLEMATRVAERSMDQFAGAAGLPSRQTEETTQQSSRNLQAIFDSGAEIAGALQQVQEELLERAKNRLQQNLDLVEAVMRARDVSELAAIQIDYARNQMESFISGSRRASELVGKAADKALKRIEVEQDRGKGRQPVSA